jgi:hypothetical protein
MADKDALAAFLDLAEAAKGAKQVVADAKAKMDTAKMANIQAEEKLKAADALKADLDKRAVTLDAREAKLNERAGNVASAEAANLAASKALSAREAEITKNEKRVSDALEAAEKAKALAQSYEGQAYQKLEAVKAKLAEAHAV